MAAFRAAMMCLVAALLYPAGMSSSTPSLISMPTDKPEHTDTHVVLADGRLTPDYHDASCPNLQAMVRTAVEEALHEDMAIAAGLLRIFFHDCFVSVS
jgi:peroxidase